MTYKALLELYNEMFPKCPAVRYWKKSTHSLRIRVGAPSQDVIFTYFSPLEWKLETIAMWEKSKDGI